MDLFSDLILAVQNDLTIGSESTLFDPNTVKLAVNRAYRKCGGLYRWPQLQNAKKTSTEENQDYYDYPQNWRPNSIWKIQVDGVSYGEPPDGSPYTFDDYLAFKEQNPDSSEKRWANQWTRFFLTPTPATDGDFNISMWGIENVETLVNDEDITIFSYSMPEANEALVLEAVAILKTKADEGTAILRKYIEGSQLLSIEAKQILEVSWRKIAQEQSKYEKIQPMFDIPDFFGRNNVKSKIGRF